MEQFFDEIDLSLLYGVGITPEHLNDDVLGRCLDKLAEYDSWWELLNGNASDKDWNPQMIDDMHQFFQSKGQDGTIFVIDSAGVSKDTLAAWHDKKLHVISRFPETFNLPEEVKARAWQEQSWNSIGKLAANKDGANYKSKSYLVEVEETPVRLIVVHSSALEILKQKTLLKKLDNMFQSLEKEVKILSKISFACEPDANEALSAFLRTQKNSPYLLTSQVVHIEEHKHA